MDILEKLDKEITEQTRNGRTGLYISTDDLEELGMTPFENKGRVWIDVSKLNKLIKRYKELQNEPEKIMQRRNEEAWEK